MKKIIVRSTDNLILWTTWFESSCLGERAMKSVMTVEGAASHIAGYWMDYLNQGQAKVVVQTDEETIIERCDGMTVRLTPATLEDIEYTAERGNFGPGVVTLDYIR